jgi:hypothetical protein
MDLLPFSGLSLEISPERQFSSCSHTPLAHSNKSPPICS